MTLEMPGIWKGVQTLVDDYAVIVPTVGGPLPATVWVNLEAADIAAGTQVTVSYSKNGGEKYTTLAIVTADGWEDIIESGITHLKFQRTAGTGVTSTCGVC